MRRPFAVIGFTWLGALIAASYSGFGISAALAVFCVICAVVVLFCIQSEKRRLPAVIFFSAAAAFVSFSITECFFYNPVAALNGRTVEFSGVIVEAPTVSYGNYYYTIKTDSISISGKKCALKVRIKVLSRRQLDADPYDRVAAKAKLSLPSTRNSSGYDSRSYNKSKGIYLFATIQGDTQITHTGSKPPYYYAIRLRQYISDAIGNIVGGERGSLAAGILIGDTTNLPEQIKNDFSDCGISHILAVSGTQTSLIMEYLMLVLCAAKIPRRISAAITTGAIAVFMAVTGFSPSVMRAGIMSILCLCAIIIKRDADVLNSLGFSAFVMCLANPYAATDVGLLLSFFATLGMVIISKRLYSSLKERVNTLPARISKIIKAPLGILCETIGASVLTYPVIIFVFGRISLISLVANMFEVPVSLFITLTTAVVSIFSPFWFLVFLIKPLAVLIRIGCAFMIWFAHILASLPFATISAEYGFIDILIIFIVILFVLFFAFKGRGAQSAVCVTCACFAVSVGIFSYTVAVRGVMAITPVGETGCTVVTSNGHAVIIDLPDTKYNPQSAVERFLKSRNITSVDAVILTTVNDNRVQALSALCSDMQIVKVYAPEKAVGNSDSFKAERIAVPSRLRAPYGVTITILPDRSKTGLLALAACASSKAVITGGGSLGDYSQYNLASFKADLLIFNNSISADFLNAVSPKNIYATSCPENTFSSLMSIGASVNNGQCTYLTRGNGSYKIMYY